MSHLPLSLMNRLNKPESAVFKLWMLYFQKDHFYRLFTLIFEIEISLSEMPDIISTLFTKV